MLNVIVAYFNYSGNPLRKKNTLDFLQYLSVTEDVDFYFIEASHNDNWFIQSETAAKGLFPNMRLYLRIPVKSIIFRKENLINIAAKYLLDGPFAWLDSDITFYDKNWPRVIQDELFSSEVVHVFSMAEILDEKGLVTKTCKSIMPLAWQMDFRHIQGNVLPGHVGFGWAMHKYGWIKMCGLPVFSIVGSGDAEFAYGILGQIDRLEIEKSPAHFTQLKNWAKNANVTCGYCDMMIQHHWHGPVMNRQHLKRDEILKNTNYDPIQDLILTPEGVLEFTPRGQRLQPALIQYLQEYT